MKRHHPAPADQVPVSRQTSLQLTHASVASAFVLEDWEIAAMAINEWMTRHSPDSIPMPATSGFQWKKLFLPNGTLLRTIFKGTNHHCLVEGDRIRYNGMDTTPSGFANVVGGSNRNAWKVIWLLFPNTQTWKLAADIRPRKPRSADSRR